MKIMKDQTLQQGILIMPEKVPRVKAPDEELAKDILKRYNEKYVNNKKYNKKARDVLNILKLEDGVLKYSSTLACIALAPIMDEMGLPLVDIVQAGNVLAVIPDAFSKIYVDLGSVLYSTGKNVPNEFYAESVEKQIKARGTELQFPTRIDFSGSSIKPASKAPYKIDIILGDANVVHAPELSKRRSFSRIENGRPVLDSNGNKTFYPGDSGLCRLFLVRYSDLDADNEDLANSDSYGRVVYSDEVAAQSLLKVSMLAGKSS